MCRLEGKTWRESVAETKQKFATTLEVMKSRHFEVTFEELFYFYIKIVFIIVGAAAVACGPDNKLSLCANCAASYLSECSGFCVDDGNVLPQASCEYKTKILYTVEKLIDVCLLIHTGAP